MPLEAPYRRLLSQIIPSLDEKALDRLSLFYDLIVETNQRINITSLTSPLDVTLKHFADSLFLLQSPVFCDQMAKHASLADVGCGGGFPGIPLACLYPEAEISMIDSTEKKIAALRENAAKLALERMRPVWGRGEELAAPKAPLREAFDLVTSRAVAALPILCELCLPFVKPGGFFFALKGKKGEEELKESREAIKRCGGKLSGVIEPIVDPALLEEASFSAKERETWEEFCASRRLIIVMEKVNSTPPAYPRAWAKITKKPL